MIRDPLTTLVGLGAVVLIASLALWLLARSSRAAVPRRAGVVQGYPPGLFPLQEVVHSGPLGALATTQARLLAAYEQVPPQSDAAIWLKLFLRELREIMDTAYRVAVIARLYPQTAALDAVVAEVQQIEAQLADQIMRQMLAREEHSHGELLAARLATLRLCARELEDVAAVYQPAL